MGSHYLSAAGAVITLIQWGHLPIDHSEAKANRYLRRIQKSGKPFRLGSDGRAIFELSYQDDGLWVLRKRPIGVI